MLSCIAIILLLFGALFLDSKPAYRSYQEILDQTIGGHEPAMSTGYKNFYSFLRLYIFGISSYFIFINYRNKKLGIILIFLVGGIIFNPILPLTFGINSIKTIDFLAASFFTYYIFNTYKSYKKYE